MEEEYRQYRYRVHLKEKERDILYKVENQDVRNKLMSIYCYFVKHSEDNKMTKSLSKFFKMYKRCHTAVETESYFSKLTYKLVKMGLLAIEKNGLVNTYIIALRIDENIPKIDLTKVKETKIEILKNNTLSNEIKVIYTIISDIFLEENIVVSLDNIKKFMLEKSDNIINNALSELVYYEYLKKDDDKYFLVL